jgi:hypothetical protein
MTSMKLNSAILMLSLISTPLLAGEVDGRNETLYDATSSLASGCDVRQQLVMTEGANLLWNTNTVCNGQQMARDTTLFARTAIETLVYLLGKAEDLAAEANSQGVSAEQELFVWDGRIHFRIRRLAGGYVAELSNASLSGDQATPLQLALSGKAGGSSAAMKLGEAIHTSLMTLSQ